VKREDIDSLYTSGILSELDIHFAGFIRRLAETRDIGLWLAAALVSRYTRQGHICLALASLGGKPLLEGENGGTPVFFPELSKWLKSLTRSSVVGRPGEYKPLILDDRSRLYLHRYWDYQEKLARAIRLRVVEDVKNIDMTLLKEGLDRLFGPDCIASSVGPPEDIDWQKVAAFTSVIKRFCVISGGPGTGKTATVAKILALVLEQANSQDTRIAIAAPTGKAAARLEEAIKRGKAHLNCSYGIKEKIPEKASTIHRLLGTIPGSPYFRYNAGNPLPVDLLVVDEASMVDMALMSKLIEALPAQARMVLLGDKDQLASVEAGAVLGDICDTGHAPSFSRRFCSSLKKVAGYKIASRGKEEQVPGIRDCIVQLEKSFRFGSESGINAVSHVINEGDADFAARILMEGKHEDIQWRDLPQPNALPGAIRGTMTKGFGDYLRASDVSEVFQRFDRFRILCAVRRGPYGVAALNKMAEQILKAEDLIEPDREWYAGRPILITRNDYNLKLFNGDVGIVLPEPGANNELRAFFMAADGTVRKFHPVRLPEHETVYAMTVHTSQGSEFDNVLLILPDKDFPVLTRELIYTAITRARESVDILAVESIFRTAVSRRIDRTSGLRDALWAQ